MAIRVGINGFGRIGRQTLKAIIERAPSLEVVAINDLVAPEMNALLVKYDSTYGAYAGTVEHKGDLLIVDGHEIRVFAEKDPARTIHRAHAPLGQRREDLVAAVQNLPNRQHGQILTAPILPAKAGSHAEVRGGTQIRGFRL